MSYQHLLFDFFSHEGIGLTVGLIFAAGMIVGTSMMYLRLSWMQFIAWVLAFGLLVVFVETVRLELFQSHGEPYTWLPVLTGAIPFTFYVSGMGVGAWIAKHWCVDEKEVMQEMLEKYESRNGNGNGAHAKHAN